MSVICICGKAYTFHRPNHSDLCRGQNNKTPYGYSAFFRQSDRCAFVCLPNGLPRNEKYDTLFLQVFCQPDVMAKQSAVPYPVCRCTCRKPNIRCVEDPGARYSDKVNLIPGSWRHKQSVFVWHMQYILKQIIRPYCRL